ncbi:MAG: ABC transporter ATP-binding protein [Planctomycetota bacterium]
MADDSPAPDARAPDAIVRVEDLAFTYRSGDFRLDVGDLSIARGATTALIGPSGSGKTTFLNLVAGIFLPERGTVSVDGTEVSAATDAARRAFRVANIGLVFQEFELLDYLSVLDNVLLPFRIAPTLSLTREVRDRAAKLARRVGLGDKLARSVRRLSQGERQRVGVCRALVTEPTLVMADEPTGNLDPDTRARVLDTLFEFAAGTDATLLTVTHDHDLLDRFDETIDVTDWRAP